MAIAALSLSAIVYLAAVVLHLSAGLGLDLNLMLLPIFCTFSVVGALIALKRPGNRIAWLCIGIGLAFGLEGLGWGITLYRATTGPGTGSEIWAVVADALIIPAVYSVITLLLLWFPDGQLPSPRWRWVARCSVVAISLAFIGGLLSEERTGWGRPQVDNPIAPSPGTPLATIIESGTLDMTIFPLLLLSVLGSIAGLIARYRASMGVERRQIKWFVFNATLAATLFLPAILLAELFGDDFGLAASCLLILIPASIGVAVLRYRLYEIDRLISRTVTYVVVAGLVVAIYSLVAIGIPQLLGLSGDDPLLVALATLAVAALFNPLRRRVQTAVDRRFNRAQIDIAEELDSFTHRLGDMSLEDISEGVIGVVAQTMQPAAASVWTRNLGPEPSSPSSAG